MEENYFATPIQRIDSSFLYEMKKEQIPEFAMDIWNSNRVILEPELEKTFEPVMEGRIEKKVMERTEAITAENNEMRSCIKELKERNASDGVLIAELQRMNEALREKCSSSNAAKTRSVVRDKLEDPILSDEVLRVDETTFVSGLFKHSRYRVHTTVNHDVLLFRPDNNGRVVCINGRISLNGLDMILPFTGECALKHSVIGRNGELKVQLV